MIARLLVFLIVSFFSQSLLAQSIAIYGSPEWTLPNKRYGRDFNYSITGYYKKSLKADKKKNEDRYSLLIGLGFANLSYQSTGDSANFICPTKDERWYVKHLDAQVYALQIPIGLEIKLAQLSKLTLVSRVELALSQTFWQHEKIDYCLCEPTDTTFTSFKLAPGYYETKRGVLDFVPQVFSRVSVGVNIPLSSKVGLDIMPSLAYNVKEWYRLKGNFGVGLNAGVVFKLG